MKLLRLRRGIRLDASEVAAEAGEVAHENLPEGTNPKIAEDEAELAAVMTASMARTRGGVIRRLGGALRRGGVGEELWDELEEILIGADVGVRTATALIEEVREAARKARVREAEEIRDLLRDAMIELLERPAEHGTLWGGNAAMPEPPHVILVVGVNGAGKTTQHRQAGARLPRGRP